MIHSFDTEIAEEYGLLESILLNNLWYWCEHNRANGTNYHDGEYWTYNSTKAMNELFPYASQRQIQNALKKLRELEIIKVGNYNTSAYDRTLWYAFTNFGKSIMQKCKMDDAKKGNQLCKNVEPIPDNKTNNKTIIKTDDKESIKDSGLSETFEEIWKSYPNKKGKPKAYTDFLKAIKNGTTVEDIQNGVNAYLYYIAENKIEPRFIKHGSTWFHNRCWEDDYTIYKKQKADFMTMDIGEFYG